MKNMWIIIILGLILRIILSLTTFHPDVQVFNLAGKIVASGNILNLYDFSSNLGVLNYPPLIYLFHGIFNFFFGTILHLTQMNQFLQNSSSNYGNFAFNINLLLLKIPYISFDLCIGYILFKLFEQTNKGKLAFTLWMFNPINLYATYMMGQFDIIPTFFIILSLYLSIQGKIKWAALVLGFGIAFKISPIFLVIPLLIFGKNIFEKIKLLALTALPYLVSIMPYLPSRSFRATALFAAQNSKSLYASLPVSGGEAIFYFPAALLVFYLFVWDQKIKDCWKLYMIPLLLFFIFTHFHPQWLLWVTPFLIADLIKSGFKNVLAHVLIFLSWLGSLFLFDPSLTMRIFAPIIPVLHNTQSIWVLLKINIDYNLSRSLLQTVFVSAAVFLIYQLFSKKSHV